MKIYYPICKVNIDKYTLISLQNDLESSNTNQGGLSIKEIKYLIDTYHILSVKKNKGDALYREDFKKATIGALVACRMKSTRLIKKATLKIGKLTSIELCLKNVLKFDNINHTVLATSTLEEDAVLKDYTYREDVIFSQGDPDDVVQRYLDVTTRLKIDVVIRLTGDNPYFSNDILKIVLKSHFESGADHSSAINACIGTNIEIINTATLKKIKHHFPNANFSEYMTYYVTNNPSYFKINKVKLPKELSRDYRLTLDYNEDLQLYNMIEEHFEKGNIDKTLIDIFNFLDSHPEVSKINSESSIVYKTDVNLMRRINEATTIK